VDLPTEGYKSITVSKEVYEKLSELAEKQHRSVPQQVGYLVENILKEVCR
jgi:predicted CopG family antitoxin